MWEGILVAAVVGAAVAYLGYRFYREFRSSSGCSKCMKNTTKAGDEGSRSPGAR